MSAYESLKPWQQRFVDLYVEGAHAPSPTAAYRIARPLSKNPHVGGYKLMARDEIRMAIDERLRRQREHSEVTEAWIMSRLQTIADRCMQPQIDQAGRLVRMLNDATNAIRALELLGKHLAMWTDKFAGPNAPVQVVQLVKYYDQQEQPQ